ncbi:aldo/keto reductase [Occultella glacieicola]|uniref:Aldo/keto reductase n=1 Tax=Occultella glacieicola TaxID=2518684 RepID=A0ABY2DWT8_9MICO|nr:aldo/keto reductase [Occultella glacieicola]TDE88346.1 aldo/keto reductase [Occultella glacieicola]
MSELPPVGLGGAAFGNLYGPVPDAVAEEILDAAWAAGIRYFDTAPHYGLGLSEERLGALLARRPRAEYVLSTKVGRLLEPNPDHVPGALDTEKGFWVPTNRRRVVDLSPAGIRDSLTASLERLGLDRVDVAYLHDPEEYPRAEAHAAIRTLIEMREEGLVTAIGAGAKDVPVLVDLVRAAAVPNGRGGGHGMDLVMVAGRYTLLEQPAWPGLVPACAEHGVGIVNVGVFNSGLLARKQVPPDATYEYGPAPAAMIERANRIAGVCARFGVDLPTAAVHFGRRARGVVNATFGLSSAAEVRELVARLDAQVDDALWVALVAEGLLPDGVIAA